MCYRLCGFHYTIINVEPQSSADFQCTVLISSTSLLLILINIRRFTVQERLTKQIAIAVTKAVQPMGVAVVVEGV